jgi:hypothetical protein
VHWGKNVQASDLPQAAERLVGKQNLPLQKLPLHFHQIAPVPAKKAAFQIRDDLEV